MAEDLDTERLLFNLKYTRLKFPCGLEIESYKDIIKSYSNVKCPIHGKKCNNIQIKMLKGGINDG